MEELRERRLLLMNDGDCYTLSFRYLYICVLLIHSDRRRINFLLALLVNNSTSVLLNCDATRKPQGHRAR